MIIERLSNFKGVSKQFVITFYAIWQNGRLFANDAIDYPSRLLQVVSTRNKAFLETLRFLCLNASFVVVSNSVISQLRFEIIFA